VSKKRRAEKRKGRARTEWKKGGEKTPVRVGRIGVTKIFYQPKREKGEGEGEVAMEGRSVHGLRGFTSKALIRTHEGGPEERVGGKKGKRALNGVAKDGEPGEEKGCSMAQTKRGKEE